MDSLGIRVALPKTNLEGGEVMAESSLNLEQRPAVKRSRQARTERNTSTSKQRRSKMNLRTPTIHPLDEALCCEARNCLQVILSGAEILIDDHVGNLLTSQKDLLAKMSDNAHHVSKLLSTVAGQEEFTLEEA
jgi:hypothetical protein